MRDLRLNVDGQRYGGWQRIRVRRGIEQIAGTFELEMTERWAGQATVRPIREGAECTVSIDGETVITGYVDDVTPEYSATSHTLIVAGRDKTGDLVDCSAPPTQFAGRTLLDVAQRLADPYGIQVRAEAPVGGAFRTLKSEDGESVFEVLEQAARIRAVLLVSDGRGGLVITRAGRSRCSTRLVLGENVLRAAGTRSWRDRYRDYTAKGQAAGGAGLWPGHDDAAAINRAQPIGRARDPGVNRHRPYTVLCEEQADIAGCKSRADWECRVRAGRASRVTYTVQDWTHTGGLWKPNEIVSVRDAYAGIEGDMLIAAVQFSLDESGFLTELETVRPDAFDLIELPEPTESGSEGPFRL